VKLTSIKRGCEYTGKKRYAEKHNKPLTMSIIKERSGGAVTYFHLHIMNKTIILAGNRTRMLYFMHATIQRRSHV
jgi:hypothetical protein